MNIYVIIYECCQDGDYESGVLDNKGFSDKLAAYKFMLKFAESKLDEWKDFTNSYKINQYPDTDSCSIESESDADYFNFYITELEIV